MSVVKSRPVRRLSVFVLVMLVVEFIDEFAFSVSEAAWPLIRDSFDLTYVQIGLLMSLPLLFANVVEPLIGLVADTKRRRLVVVVGGVVFGVGLMTQAFAPGFFVLMLAFAMQTPSSGAFVNVAQASLMDDDPTRRESNMALWTFAGSLAVVAGPLALAGVVALGGGWRPLVLATGVAAVLAATWIARLPANRALRTSDDAPERSLRDNLRGAWGLLRRWTVWRWLVLLQFSDLMLDSLFALLALYMVDVVGVSQTQAAIAVAVWTGVGLLGDFLLIPLLERVSGLAYLRVSVAAELVLFPAFLLVDGWWTKLMLLGVIGLFNAGWYAILQGRLYDALGEQSGAILIVSNVAGVFGALLPIALGVIAQAYGLGVALWFLMLGPIALAVGLPRREPAPERVT